MSTELSNRPTSGMSRLLDRDPFRALQQRMDDLLGNFSREFDGGWLSAGTHPSLDISETEDAIQVRVDLPGIRPDDVNVEVRGNQLQITGERHEEREEQGRTWHQTERHVGRFSRMLTLPCEVRDDDVEAEYTDGVLNISLPKAESARSHRIPVKAK